MTQNIIQPEELNLITVFKNNEYIIPIYQRNYAWEKDEIEQLITDIDDSDGRYYLGSLIVNQIDTKTFSVIDGQQRLTTIFLLLALIKPELISTTSLKFEAREKSNRTLEEIQKQKLLKKDISLYSEELINGFDIIVNFCETKGEEYKKNICKKLSNILIIKTQVPKKIDLNHYFEIMNTRGEQLEIHEIAKGRILSVIHDENEENIAAFIWDACSQMDSYIQMNFDTNSRRNLFGEKWDEFIPDNFNSLKDKIKIETLKAQLKYSLKTKLENLVIENNNLNKTEENEENERFEPIVSFPNFLLLVNESLQSKDKEDDASLDDKKFLKTMEKHWDNKISATQFIYDLLKLRFLFDNYLIKREFAKDYKEEGKWSLQKLEMYFDENKKQKKPSYKQTYYSTEKDDKTQNLKLLQSALRITYTSPKTMHWISKALNELYKDNKTDLINVLENYACKKIIEKDYRKAKGFGIDRIVFTYLDYVLERDKKTSIPNFQFQYRTSIEHFYPQHPSDSKRWEDEDLHSLGNLALITIKSNSKFSNLSPQSKVDTYPNTINQSPKLKLMSELMLSNIKWNQDIAKIHEKEMIDILKTEISKQGL